MKSSVKIALTGGIACGKSSARQILQTLGYGAIDLDDLSREITQVGSAGLGALVAKFGDKILKNGALNRAVLRQILLQNLANQRAIEDILHPLILSAMQIKIAQQSHRFIIVEVPILTAKNLKYFDRVLIIETDKHVQLSRLMARNNLSKSQAKKQIAAQIIGKKRLKIASALPHDLIQNNQNIADLTQSVQKFHQKLVNLQAFDHLPAE